MRRSDQVASMPYKPNKAAISNSSNAAPARKSSTVDTKITPPTTRPSSDQPKENTDVAKMEEESIAIVSSNTSDASSISSLSGGSFSTSSSSSSLQTAATSNLGKVPDEKGRSNAGFVPTVDESLPDIDKTPVSYELSLSMYDGLLETCRPFYFPSDREQSDQSSSVNVVHKIPPRLEDALEMQQREKARSSSSQTIPSRKRAIPTLLDKNDRYGGRKVRVKTITFQEPSVPSRKKSKTYK